MMYAFFFGHILLCMEPFLPYMVWSTCYFKMTKERRNVLCIVLSEIWFRFSSRGKFNLQAQRKTAEHQMCGHGRCYSLSQDNNSVSDVSDFISDSVSDFISKGIQQLQISGCKCLIEIWWKDCVGCTLWLPDKAQCSLKKNIWPHDTRSCCSGAFTWSSGG